MSGFEVRVDVSQITRLANLIGAAGDQVPHAIRRGLNKTGDKVRTVVVRSLAKQTGAKYGAVKKALKVTRADYRDLKYTIAARGSHIPLRDFGPRRTKKGISAAPWNNRQVFDHTFFIRAWGGHVFARVGQKRGPVHKLWGPSIARELVRGEAAAAFITTAAADLPSSIAHELGAILSGAAPRGR